MSSFTDPLDVRQQADGDWVTLRAFTYWTDCDDTSEAPVDLRCKTSYTVPEGTETDFASIPRLAWTWIGHPAGRYAQAAVLHDCLYRSGLVTRRKADELFREAMGVLGVPAWQRWAMWAAVRVGGSFAFDDNKVSP